MKVCIKLFILGLCVSISAQALNKNPSSGRHLPRGHWLTCWGGSDEAIRVDPHFNKWTPEDEVASYIPRFSGSYSFQVKDTWTEVVTHSGMDCFHCGQTCTTTKKNTVCICNSCSWQTSETAYRPWSTQSVKWDVSWIQDQNYRALRRDWIEKGQPVLSRTPQDLDKLLLFDPERPLEYFLFPGEAEHIEISNGWGGSKVSPRVEITRARHEYDIRTESNMSDDCDDKNISLSAFVRTGKRLRGATPNSIEFRKEWAVGQKNEQGEFVEEPGEFRLTDISAERYENQNIFENYKDSRMSVELWHVHRFLWAFDSRVSASFKIQDNLSVLKWSDADSKTKSPPVAIYDIKADDLYRTRWTGAQLHLTGNETYEVCTKMIRKNNIYYSTRFLYFFDQWSDSNCALFVYNPTDQKDQRSWVQKKRDFFSRLIGFGLF